MTRVENVKESIEYESWGDRHDRNANGMKTSIDKWKKEFNDEDLRAFAAKLEDLLTRLNYREAWYKRTMPDLAAALRVDAMDLGNVLRIIYENRSVSYDNIYHEPNWVKKDDDTNQVA